MTFEKFVKLFANCWDGRQNEESIKRAINVFNSRCEFFNDRLHFACGSTRICALNNEYVLKFDYGVEGCFGDNETEYLMYQEARKDGFGYMFAEVYKVEIEGKLLYVQDWIDMNFPKGDCYDFCEIATSEEEEYLNEHGIEDLHDENWGWDANTECWVIFDYACNHYSERYEKLSSLRTDWESHSTKENSLFACEGE